MDYKINCWEFFGCGREPGGDTAKKLGVCPVFTSFRSHRKNHGKKAGRACWEIKSTACHNSLGSSFNDCTKCPFFLLVQYEEDHNLQTIELDNRPG